MNGIDAGDWRVALPQQDGAGLPRRPGLLQLHRGNQYLPSATVFFTGVYFLQGRGGGGMGWLRVSKALPRFF